MNKIQSIGNLWNPIRQNLDLLVHSRVGQKWENFINIFNSQKLMIFTENRTTCKEVKVTRFCRMEFQRPPHIPEVSTHTKHTIYTSKNYNVGTIENVLMQNFFTVEFIFRGSGQKRNWLFVMKITYIWTILLKLRCWTFVSLFFFFESERILVNFTKKMIFDHILGVKVVLTEIGKNKKLINIEMIKN